MEICSVEKGVETALLRSNAAGLLLCACRLISGGKLRGQAINEVAHLNLARVQTWHCERESEIGKSMWL